MLAPSTSVNRIVRWDLKDFRSLKVWAKAHALTLATYRETRGFPKEELYGLTSQMRRCAASVPSNLAEGCGRTGDNDFARFVEMAASSALELEYQLLLSHDLEFIDQTRYRELNSATVEVKQMLASLIRTLRSTNGQAPAKPRSRGQKLTADR